MKKNYDYNMKSIFASLLCENVPPFINRPSVLLSGISGKNRSSFGLNDEILSRHLLMIGSTGTGKTNLFYHIVKQLKAKMTDSDVMLIFDSKGDFYDKFFSPADKDIVIGNSAKYRKLSERWNIYEEIISDGRDKISVSQNIREICKSLFAKRLENSGNNNPFFPTAASDVLAAVMLSFGSEFNNNDLRRLLDSKTAKEFQNMFSGYPELRSVSTYIDPKGGAQSLGVLGELYSIIHDVLTGVFAEPGNFSMRKFIREKNKRTAFIEYDLAIGDVLVPIYTLLFDLALKEALGRTTTQGNVYLIADELKLLPNLRHLDDGINFGRSLGLKILAGLQSIDQLTANYSKEATARNAIAGFSSIVAFRSTDITTRKYISDIFGKNMLLEMFTKDNGETDYKTREGRIVEDWDIASLELGEAIVGLTGFAPFRFKFKPYTG